MYLLLPFKASRACQKRAVVELPRLPQTLRYYLSACTHGLWIDQGSPLISVQNHDSFLIPFSLYIFFIPRTDCRGLETGKYL